MNDWIAIGQLVAALAIITGLVVFAVRAGWLDKLSAGALWGALTGAAYLAWSWLTRRREVEPPADEPDRLMDIRPTTTAAQIIDEADADAEGPPADDVHDQLREELDRQEAQ